MSVWKSLVPIQWACYCVSWLKKKCIPPIGSKTFKSLEPKVTEGKHLASGSLGTMM